MPALEGKRRRPPVHRLLHRRLGMLAALPFLVVAATGILLAWKPALTAAWPSLEAVPWEFLFHLHRSLCAGAVGRATMSLLGAAVLLIWGSGLRLLCLSRIGARTKHARFGLWLGLPLVFVCILGAGLNYAEGLADWLDPVPPGTSWTQLIAGDPKASADPKFKYEPRADAWASVRAAASAVEQKAPVRSYAPTQKRPYFLFYYADDTRVYLDAGTHLVVKIRSPSLHWTSALRPLHALRFAGPVAPILSSLLAAALGFLAWRGLQRLKMRAAGALRLARSDAVQRP